METQLKDLKQGQRIKCDIQTNHWHSIDDAKIYIEKNNYFICQDVSGEENEEEKEKRFGYEYSILLGSRASAYLDDRLEYLKIRDFAFLPELEKLEKKLLEKWNNKSNVFKKSIFLQEFERLATEHTNKELKNALLGKQHTEREIISILKKFYPYEVKNVKWYDTSVEFCKVMLKRLKKEKEASDQRFDPPLPIKKKDFPIIPNRLLKDKFGNKSDWEFLHSPFYRKGEVCDIKNKIFDNIEKQLGIEIFPYTDEIIDLEDKKTGKISKYGEDGEGLFQIHELRCHPIKSYMWYSIYSLEIYDSVSAFSFYDKYLFDYKYKTNYTLQFMQSCLGWFFDKNVIHIIKRDFE